MSGLGGLNKSPKGAVLGLVQLQLPVVVTPSDLATQTQKICGLVRYRLPWEGEVVVTDGTSCGFPAPTREYQPQAPQTDTWERRKYA
jgi:hypothetical protein